jgi:hypothetical protein
MCCGMEDKVLSPTGPHGHRLLNGSGRDQFSIVSRCRTTWGFFSCVSGGGDSGSVKLKPQTGTKSNVQQGGINHDGEGSNKGAFDRLSVNLILLAPLVQQW